LILSIYLKSAAALGGLFMLVDIGGEGYHLAPQVLTVTLTKADGPPRVDTMVLDADDLRNVTWIRIHLVKGHEVPSASLFFRPLPGI
jgi:hypothetical protein